MELLSGMPVCLFAWDSRGGAGGGGGSGGGGELDAASTAFASSIVAAGVARDSTAGPGGTIRGSGGGGGSGSDRDNDSDSGSGGGRGDGGGGGGSSGSSLGREHGEKIGGGRPQASTLAAALAFLTARFRLAEAGVAAGTGGGAEGRSLSEVERTARDAGRELGAAVTGRRVGAEGVGAGMSAVDLAAITRRVKT